MPVVVEDGTIVANANSYNTLAELREFALARGIALSAVDATLTKELTLAMDYLESLRDKYQGIKISQDQPLQFPRIYVIVDGFAVPSDEIPALLKQAQCQLVIEIENNVDIMPTFLEPAIKKETIGPISTEYAVSNGSYFEPFMSKVDSLLKPIFKNVSEGFTIRTMRV